MRTRLSVAVALLLLVGLAAPAAAEPANSNFVEESLVGDIEFPNPCLGEGVVEMWHFDGRLLIHEFTNPSGNYHFNDIGYIALWTDSGFAMPEKMIGVDVENISTNAYSYTGTGLYQLRNDDNEKLRFQIKVQATVVDGDVKVDMFGLDFDCLGNF